MKDMVQMIRHPLMRKAVNGKITDDMIEALAANMPNDRRLNYKNWVSVNWGVSLTTTTRALQKFNGGQ